MRKDSLTTLMKDVIIFAKLITIKKPMSSYNIAKKIFNPKTDYELRKRDNYMKFFFERWKNYGIIKCESEEENGRKIYSINLNKIKLGKTKVEIEGKNMDLGFCFSFKLGDNWVIVPFEKFS